MKIKRYGMLLRSSVLASAVYIVGVLSVQDGIAERAGDSSRSRRAAQDVVIYADGNSLRAGDVAETLLDLPDRVKTSASYIELETVAKFRKIYEKVMDDLAVKDRVGEKEDVRKSIARKKAREAGMMWLEKEARAAMTPEALKEHYDKTYEEQIKGTKEFVVMAIPVPSMDIVAKMKKAVKDEKSLKEFMKKNGLQGRDMKQPEAAFPPEMAEAIKKAGINGIAGPIKWNGEALLVFYIKGIDEAKKEPFTEEFARRYEAVAMPDFMRDLLKSLHKKYNVQMKDVRGKSVDSFKMIEEERESRKSGDKKESSSVNLAAIKDDVVLATMQDDQVTVKSLCEYLGIPSLTSGAFQAMAQQAGLDPEKFIVHAARIVVDDKLAAKEAEAAKFVERDDDARDRSDALERQEMRVAILREVASADKKEVESQFNQDMKSLPDAAKNDQIISAKMVFFATHEDAMKALRSINAGDKKFSDIYKEKIEKKEAADLGEMVRENTPAPVWEQLSGTHAGTCSRDIIDMRGSQFAAGGLNYGVAYVMEKKKRPLPSLDNPDDLRYYEERTKVVKAAKFVEGLMLEGVKTIDGRAVSECLQDGHNKQILEAVVGAECRMTSEGRRQ